MVKTGISIKKPPSPCPRRKKSQPTAERRVNMNNKEWATALLELVPEYKMGYVVAYLQGLTADEQMDDAFVCSSIIVISTTQKKATLYLLKTH